jgi:hypothetical protein
MIAIAGNKPSGPRVLFSFNYITYVKYILQYVLYILLFIWHILLFIYNSLHFTSAVVEIYLKIKFYKLRMGALTFDIIFFVFKVYFNLIVNLVRGVGFGPPPYWRHHLLSLIVIPQLPSFFI